MNNVFKKHFFSHFFVLVLIFILLGVGTTKIFSSFFITQKIELLTNQAEKIFQVCKQSLFFGGQVEKEVKKIENYLECSFIITNVNDCILVTSSDISKEWVGARFKFLNINEDTDEERNIFNLKGTMGGIFSKPMLTLGYPIIIGNIDLGTIFTIVPILDIVYSIGDLYKIIVIIMVISILMSFLLVYIFSRKISVPLNEINKAARIMADGNFEKRININCEGEIKQLADALNEMSSNLNEQEKRRREFISNISHDIRSPLTSMKGFLQALIDGTIPDDKRERYLNIVLEETERLTRLSNNILDINRLEDVNGSIKNIKFNINQLIRNIIISFEARVISKELKVQISFDREEIFVFADIEKTERVVYNLIDNAIKFTKSGKSIFVETKIKGDKVLVFIKDEGIGIAPDAQKRIFERFYKVDASRGEDKKGSGLGLSIVKEFILSQGETITLNSDIDKGSEFIFTLTLDK